MKKTVITTQICLGLLMATAAQADTTLQIPALYGCLADFGSQVAIASPPSQLGSFTLDGVSGAGVIQSQVPSYWDEHVPPVNTENKLYTYAYTIDLSGMSSGTNPATNHCVKLLIHFGDAAGCFQPGVEGDPSQIQSATLNPWGDITFVFNGGCLGPGQPAVTFSMVTDAGYKTNIVTVIDDYMDTGGLQHEVKINVPAIVPDVPPDPPVWVMYAETPHPTFQGMLYQFNPTNPIPKLPATNGNYDFAMQLVAWGTNGPALSAMTTQTVSVVNGLFTIPLPGDPVSFADGSVRYLNLGVKSSINPGPNQFLTTPLPITPAPSALYAFSAGTVADIAPGQAVTSLNGLTDGVMLEAGTGIMLNTSGNMITISATGSGPSDRNLKTDIVPVNPQSVLARLAAMPVESWRYTNEVAGIRHVGPMAQDFKAAFGLGDSDKTIGYLDASGVALAAIQGLNQKLTEELQRENAENAALRQQVVELQRMAGQLNQKLEQKTK